MTKRITSHREVLDYLLNFFTLIKEINFNPGLETPHLVIKSLSSTHQFIWLGALTWNTGWCAWQNHKLTWSHLYSLWIIKIYKWELYKNKKIIGKPLVFYKIQKKPKWKTCFTGTETRVAQESSTGGLLNSVLCNKRAVMRLSKLSLNLVVSFQIPKLIGQMLRLVLLGIATWFAICQLIPGLGILGHSQQRGRGGLRESCLLERRNSLRLWTSTL